MSERRRGTRCYRFNSHQACVASYAHAVLMHDRWQVLQGWKMNCVALDKRSWLEVRDKQHRYGKNLRLYFKVRSLNPLRLCALRFLHC